MSKNNDDFWNKIAISQMASGQAPSITTKTMKKALDGDKDAAKEISDRVDVKKAAIEGLLSIKDKL